MPARLTPNQKDRLSALGRRSLKRAIVKRHALNVARGETLDVYSYGDLAAGTIPGAWVSLSTVGGERTLDHCVEKGYAECREEYGPRGGRILFYRPTMQGWDWLARQDRGETVASDGTVRDALGNFAGIDQPAAAR